MSRPKITPGARAARHDRLSRRFDVLTDMLVETREELRKLEREMLEKGEMEDTRGATGTLDFPARRAGS